MIFSLITDLLQQLNFYLTAATAIGLIFLFHNLKKPTFVCLFLVLLYFFFDDVTDHLSAFHLCLLFCLVYLCYLSVEADQENKNYFLLSLLLTSFILFEDYWLLLFILCAIVVLISFSFFVLGPYLDWHLSLKPNVSKPILADWKSQALVRLKEVFYDPKYMALIEFWKVTFPKRIAKPVSHIFSEICSLVVLSLSTLLHTRYRLLLPGFFARCFLSGHVEWLLYYFIPVLLLTFLVYFPPYVKYIKEIYGENVFKELGWNTGIFQAIAGARVAVKVGTGVAVGYFGDELLSTKYLNEANLKLAWANYNSDINAWREARWKSDDYKNFPHQPTPPNTDLIRSQRLRHHLPNILTAGNQLGDLFGLEGPSGKKPK